MNSPVIVQKSFLASSSPRVESSWIGVGECNSSVFTWRISYSLLVPDDPGLRWMCSDAVLRQRFWLFHLRLGKWSFHFFAALTLPLHWALGCGVLMRPSPPSLQCLRPQRLLSRFSRVQSTTEKYTWQDFCSKLMQSRLVFAEIGTIAPNGITGPPNGIPNRLSCCVFPSDKRSWMFRR